tara:strand:+ start:460 stop:1296 length:837 start_codon:yes stop_codon:yes gene_type:complete
MKQRCIFTLLINSATPYNNNHLNIKSTNNQQQNTLPLYYDLFKVLNEDRQDYATFCDSDYMCYELNDEFIEFERAIKNKCISFTPYDVIQYYKIHLCEQLSKQYKEVLYLDFDVIIGDVKKNFFTEWDLSKGLVIKNEFFDCTKFQYTPGMSSRYIKAFLAHLVLKYMNIDHDATSLPHINTGILGCNNQSISSINFFDILYESLKILDDIYLNEKEHWKYVRFSNEIVFTVSWYLNKFKMQSIVDDQNIWHKKANGVNDLNSVFLHCTGKHWLELYT